MNEPKLVDEAARLKISGELNKTFLVEAGAGSGKTKSLVDRMIALLKSGQCQINNLAAVTFTRKAAAELRGRFQTELEKSLAGEKDEKIKERLSESLQNLEQCYIGTIHSFCAKLLRERPLEIALDPEFEELEEIENAVFREQCWNDYVVKVRLEDEEIMRILDGAGLVPEDLKDSYIALSLYPEVDLIGGTEDAPDFSSYRGRLERFLDEARAVVPTQRPQKGFDGPQRCMRRCFVRQRNLGFEDPRILMETFELLDRRLKVTKIRWPSSETADSFQGKLDIFKEEVAKAALKEWREYRHSKALDFLKPAVRFFNDRRIQQSKLNFEDLLINASRLLRDNPEVRQYFSKKYTHILVDEFQDTDPIQAEVILYLTGHDFEERDWRKLVPRPGSLFLVGDPKQSIFRFRRADIDTYNMVKGLILKTGGEILYLTSNFRSLHSLAKWNNPVFAGIFPEQANRYQPAFAPLDTVREDEENTWFGVFKISVPKVARNVEKQIAEHDAKAIANWISWACAGNVRFARTEEEKEKGLGSKAQPSDFLILFRYKKNMNIYARALEDRGIPFEITGSDAFSESEEIREIVNLSRALSDPDNPIYTVAVLRGIFFGVSDNELLQFKREGERFSFLSSGVTAKDKSESKVVASLEKLKEWWQWTKYYPATTALEMIFENSGILNYLAASEMGSSKAGNLFKLLELLRSREREGVTSFAGLAEFMEEVSLVYEVEEISLTPGRANAVRLMNLHKAKGLEAPVVFLANPVGIRDHEPDKHVIRMEAAPKGYFLFKKNIGFQGMLISQPVDWEARAEEEMKYQEAEEARLMYVASTRARNILVISTYEGDIYAKRAWRFLDDALGSVPELKIIEEAAVREREKLVLKKAELALAREEIGKNINLALRPSYWVESVTSLAKEDKKFPAWRRSGYGLSWGRVVHNVLSVLGGGGEADLELLAENALIAEDRDLEERSKLLELVDAVQKSEFWQRVLKADDKYFEVPFSVKTDRSGIPLGEDAEKKFKEEGISENLPVVLTGAIDLAFFEKDGWVIADYKTDKIEDDLDSYVEFYAPQIKLYSQFWEDITKQKVKEAGLFFININEWIRVYPDS